MKGAPVDPQKVALLCLLVERLKADEVLGELLDPIVVSAMGEDPLRVEVKGEKGVVVVPSSGIPCVAVYQAEDEMAREYIGGEPGFRRTLSAEYVNYMPAPTEEGRTSEEQAADAAVAVGARILAHLEAGGTVHSPWGVVDLGGSDLLWSIEPKSAAPYLMRNHRLFGVEVEIEITHLHPPYLVVDPKVTLSSILFEGHTEVGTGEVEQSAEHEF